MSIITPRYFMIGAAFVVFLLLSNIVAGKLVTFGGVVLPAAVVLFPVTYIFGDILTEVYGFKGSRLVIWTGLLANVFMAAVFLLVLALPYPGFWLHQDAYAQVLGITPKVVFASVLGYFCGEFCNSVTLSALKKATKGKHLWFRTISSTVVGEGVDTLIFISIVFAGAVAAHVLYQMILAQYLFKVAYEVLATPLTYAAAGWLKKREKLDVYDYGVVYNPFGLDLKYSDENLMLKNVMLKP